MLQNCTLDYENLQSIAEYSNLEQFAEYFYYSYQLFGIFNFFVNVYFIIRVAATTAIHVNFRINVCSTALSYELMHFTMPIGRMYYQATKDVKDRFFVNVKCSMIAWISNCAAISCAVSMFMLALERQIAYVWVNVYEHKPKTLGCMLVTVVIIQSLLVGTICWYVFSINFDNFDFENSCTGCVTTDLHWEWEFLGYAFAAVTCICGAIWLFFLKRRTSRNHLNRLTLESLSARYQATENSLTTSSISMSMFLYTIQALIGAALGGYRGSIVKKYGENTIISKFLAQVG
ncbi:unnamed protein product [Bursaphelenchus xylophilus]|uniref:(pine wood nematode) hypothetical protein n=1 Tax=Bursaphelenchus xylophilus TaxID=6326 RepID=A0A7I8X5F5_BURXY|nr:unnamed protein product [Bursaphelenchus xylophilus]CAG9122417.1 unnamed protein product [Bursaphelenchus xylophilus]